MNELAPHTATHDERVDCAIVEYLVAAEGGRAVDRGQWLARHPDLAAELQHFLDDQDHVGAVLAPLHGSSDQFDTPMARLTDDDTGPYPRPRRGPLSTLQLPCTVGNFEVLEEIARGGMGVVYRARQHGLNRVVALKMVLASRLAPRKEVERFYREAEAAAGLDHPNIVPIHEVGDFDGLPYFSMKLIEGGSLSNHRDRYAGDGRATARLLTTVARAVHHAHQRGILHRDLKPSNILLDEAGEPHVADFGLAMHIGNPNLAPPDGPSQSGTIAGTPSYMAPEQARGDAKRLTISVDVYGLGAILYELLGGKPPFRGESAAETLLLILTQEPPPPSQLHERVPRDLETICLKCLDKQPARRYESAEALALDLDRFLAGEPILARPAGRAERAWRWCRRNPAVAGLLGAVAVLLLAVAGIAAMWAAQMRDDLAATQLAEREALRQRDAVAWEKDRADRAKQAETDRAEGERRAKETAQKRLAQIQKSNDILGGIFIDLNPLFEGQGAKPLRVLLGERLDRAAKDLNGDAVGDPLAVAKLQTTLGHSLLQLGYADKAVTVLTAAHATRLANLGPDHPDTFISASMLASALQEAGSLDRALPLFRETLQRRRAVLGLQHPSTLTSMNNLAMICQATGQWGEALSLLEEVVEFRKSKMPANHPDTLVSMNNLAIAIENAGKIEQALALYKEAFDGMKTNLGPQHPNTLKTMAGLARAHQAVGNVDQALAIFEEALTLSRTKFGPDHPGTLISMSNLGAAYHRAGMLDKALRLLEEALPLMKAKLGPKHYSTLMCTDNLASIYQALKRVPEALPLFEEAFRQRLAILGPDHLDTLRSGAGLGAACLSLGRLEEARGHLEEAFKEQKRRLGPGNHSTLVTMCDLADTYKKLDMLDRAVPLSEECLKLHRANRPPGHPNTLHALTRLAAAYLAAGTPERAVRLADEMLLEIKNRQGASGRDMLLEIDSLAIALWKAGNLDLVVPLFEETLRLHQAELGPDHPDTLQSMANLGVNYRDAGRLRQAIPLLEESVARANKGGELTATKLEWVLTALADTYDAAGLYDQAEPIFQQSLAEARKQFAANDRRLAARLAPLGLNLLHQGKWVEAEAIAREALVIREKTQPELWSTFNAKSLLGGSLLGQRKYAEAEPLLLSGYEGIKARRTQIPPQFHFRLTEAEGRVIDLYEATGRAELAAAWRDKRPPELAPKPRETGP